MFLTEKEKEEARKELEREERAKDKEAKIRAKEEYKKNLKSGRKDADLNRVAPKMDKEDKRKFRKQHQGQTGEFGKPSLSDQEDDD